MYVRLPTLGRARGARHVLTEKVYYLAAEDEERPRSAHRRNQDVTRAIRPAPERERRPDRARFLSQRAVQAALDMILLLKKLDAFLGRPG